MNDLTPDEIRLIQKHRAEEAMRQPRPPVPKASNVDSIMVEILEKIRKMSLEYREHAQKTLQSIELGSIKTSEAARLMALADGMNIVFDMLQDMRVEIRNGC